MPLLWRYLLHNYLRVFFLCVTGFISILLVTRFQSIARFATTGASKLLILKFIFLQIPHILPLAIPVSCLIAALLLFQTMSRSHELTALRIGRLGIFPIAFPLLLCGGVITLLNFSIVSEISPKCRSLSKTLAYEMSVINPLCLLQKDTVIKLKNVYIDMKHLQSGKYAKDVFFVLRNASNHRLGLLIASKISLKEKQLLGEKISFITTLDPKERDAFDHLVIENQSNMQLEADQLSQYLYPNEWNTHLDYLNMRMLLAKLFSNNYPVYSDSSTLIEIAKRISLGLAAFTFTLIGVSFGMEITFEKKRKKLFSATVLAMVFFLSFLAAKSMKHSFMPNIILLFGSHLIIILFCRRAWNQISMGTE